MVTDIGLLHERIQQRKAALEARKKKCEIELHSIKCDLELLAGAQLTLHDIPGLGQVAGLAFACSVDEARGVPESEGQDAAPGDRK